MVDGLFYMSHGCLSLNKLKLIENSLVNNSIQMKQEAQIFKTRQISLNEKKQLMWNIIEPGDPYDIRKSMIASLPGQKKFMGAHLELICLLQAAEIQRLCTFLEEYSLKIREQQRVQLDRHSYEIQIKELTQKLTVDEGFRLQNEKLKDFIRKQSKELQDSQRKPPTLETTKKYEDSLRQLEVVIKENSELKASLQKFQQESNIRNQQIRMLQFSYQQQLQKQNERASLQRNEKQQLEQEKINLKIQREVSLKKCQDQLNNFRSKCVELTNKLQVSQNSNRSLKEQTQRLTIEKTRNEQLIHTVKEYESRFELLAAQVERLNKILREKAKQLNQQYIRLKQLAQQKKTVEDVNNEQQLKIRSSLTEIQRLQNQNKQIWLQRSNYEERQMLIRQYEERMQKLSLQVERLNAVLRKKINDLDESRKKCRQLQLYVSNMEMVEKQVGDLRVKLTEVSKKIFQYEKQTTTQFHEIQRLNYTLKRMLDQVNYAEVKLKNSQKQLQNQVKRNSQLQNELNGISEVNRRLKQNYQESLRVFKLQFQTKHVSNQQSVINENNYLRSQINKQNNSLQELRSLINAQNQQIIEQKRANEQLIKNVTVSQQYVSKLQAKIGFYQQQVKQLNQCIKRESLKQSQQITPSKVEDQKILNKQAQISHLKLEIQTLLKKEITFHQLRQESLIKQDEIKGLRKEIQVRQAHINDQLAHIHWFQNRCRQLDEKIINLLKDCDMFYIQNNELKNNMSSLQAQNYQLKAQVENLRKGVIQRTEPPSQSKYFSGAKLSQTTGLKSQSPDYQLVKISREYQILKQEYQELLTERRQQRQSSSNLIQHNRLISQNQALKLKIQEQGEYYKKVLIFSQEIERLNGVLQIKENQAQNTLFKLKQYEQRILYLEERMIQTTLQLNSIRQNSGVASSNMSQISHYENQVKALRDQLQSSLAANVEKDTQISLYQNKISLLGQQIQRLNNILKIKVHQNDELMQVQLSLRNERVELIQQLKHSASPTQMIALYEEKLTLMKSQIQRLNMVLHEKLQSFSSLNGQYSSYRQNQQLKATSLNRQMAEYESRINQLNGELSQIRNRNSLKENNETILADYESKIFGLSNQVDRLNMLLRGNGERIEELGHRDNSYLKEIERLNNALRIKVQECESRNISESDLRGQIKSIKQLLAQERSEQVTIAQNRDMFSQELVKAKQQMYSYQTRIQDLYDEFQRLQVIMKILKEENQSYKQKESSLDQLIRKNKNLGAEIDRLTLLVNQRTQELRQVRLTLTGEISLEKRINQDLTLLVILFAEIQSLRLRVQQAESQSEQVRRSIASSNRV